MGTSAINKDYLRIGNRVADLLGRPAIVGLHLPAPVADETFRDEFGFVFLADGSIGPFYVSMGDMLVRLWERYPDPARRQPDPMALLQGFAGPDLAARALALGSYNALSAALYHASGFVPPDRPRGSATDDRADGRPVGMVGYFCPLVDRLTAQGREVLVLERWPERVPGRERVRVTDEPADLRHCQRILCTASTLINDSLETILAAVDGRAPVELIGPSGSGLPDPLFARGVAAVGGVSFGDRERLLGHLGRGESWGEAGRKYQLDPAGYPGLDRLIRQLADRRADTGQP